MAVVDLYKCSSITYAAISRGQATQFSELLAECKLNALFLIADLSAERLSHTDLEGAER
jgi:hypothetical protein